MRTGSDASTGAASVTARPHAPATALRDAMAVSELFLGVFRRDLASFYPKALILSREEKSDQSEPHSGPVFRLIEDDFEGPSIDLFGVRYDVKTHDGQRFSSHDLRMIRAIGTVLGLRYHHLFQINHPSRLELFRGGSEDHYVAAFVEPWAYTVTSPRPSRIASTIQTLRTAALSTYENRRVSTGALLIGPGDDLPHPAPADALPYGVELTALKSIHRLCDGKRTVFLVDRDGKLVEVVDIAQWGRSLRAG